MERHYRRPWSKVLQLNTNVKHFQQWMSWLPHRWRTQWNAIRHANCKISESSKLWTHLALPSGSMSVGVSVHPHHSPKTLKTSFGCWMPPTAFLESACRWKHNLITDPIQCNAGRTRDDIITRLTPGNTFKLSRSSIILNRTSNQSRIPAEFKHITRRRKRN